MPRFDYNQAKLIDCQRIIVRFGANGDQHAFVVRDTGSRTLLVKKYLEAGKQWSRPVRIPRVDVVSVLLYVNDADNVPALPELIWC